MKILWMSNAPWAHTGYGVDCKQVVPRLKQAGFDIGIFAFYGLMGGLLKIQDIPIYPVRADIWGRDVCFKHYKHFGADVLVTHLDVWVYKDYFPKFVTEGKGRWISVCPLDHDPMPPWIAQTLKFAYKIVAMSKYGEQQLKDEGFNSDRVRYIPKGADTNILKPGERDVNRLNACLWEGSRKMGVKYEADDFIIGMIASNKGLRKEFGRMLEGIRIFLENNPDAKSDTKVFMHTDLEEPSGLRLEQLCSMWGLEKNVGIIDSYLNFLGMSEDFLANEYNCFDVFMNTARGEGFCQPIMEAFACGVPVIASDCTSMMELINDSQGGELVRIKDRDLTHILAYQFLPDPQDIAVKLEKLYNSKQLRDKYGRNARKYAEKHSWEKIVKESWIPFLREVQEELRPSQSMLGAPDNLEAPLGVPEGGNPAGGVNTLL